MVQTKTQWKKETLETIRQGLAASRKTLPSWLFYDETGDRIFQQIMRMPEYYPTRCEYDILQKHKAELRKRFLENAPSFRLIEFGAGDGLKTEVLLKHFIESDTPFTYVPVDISANVLQQLSSRLTTAYPQLRVDPINNTYEGALAALRGDNEKTVVLFMGANIGNFSIPEASRFLKRMTFSLRRDDMILIGFDLKKDPRTIQEAYDDRRGLTSRFNLNILQRLNRELGARFDLDSFSHYPYYDPYSGTTKSFLISMRPQTVWIEALNESFEFGLWEPVQTEVSQKYDVAMIRKLLALNNLKIAEIFFDKNQYFCDVLAKPAEW